MSADAPSIEIQHEFTVVSVADKTDYLAPLGVFFSKLLRWSLEVDQGGGFGPFSEADPLVRTSTPPSVSDLAFGFRLRTPPQGGWTFRFRWLERRLLTAPAAAATAVRLVGNQVDDSVAWSYKNPAAAPNGVLFPCVDGTQVEFWRLTRPVGGSRGGGKSRLGRRYVPYLRCEQNRFAFSASELLHGGRTRRFKACYATPDGARSDLCWGTIVVSCSGSVRVIK